jgi:hypothetical protein
MSIPCPQAPERPFIVPEKRQEAPKPPKPDTFTEVSPGIWKNDRTGQMETRFPLPQPTWIPYP